MTAGTTATSGTGGGGGVVREGGTRGPVEAAGGSADPQSRFVADVEAVQRAALVYRSSADAMGRQAAELRRLDLRLADALLSRGDAVSRIVDAWRLWRLADRLASHAGARAELARRAQAAVALYRDVDESSAAAFDRLLRSGEFPPMPPPWILERQGRCSSPGDAEQYRLPTCPGYKGPTPLDPADLMRPQRLFVGEVRRIPPPSRPRPGLGGAFRTVHDNYGAPSSDGTEDGDPIDIRRHVHVDPDGRRRETYVVAFAGTSGWDLLSMRQGDEQVRTLRPNLEGALGRASAEARLVPEVLARAGVPPGAEILLAGHSQGGMTATAAAALPEMRRYRLSVLTAGSPTGRMPVVPGVSYLHVVNPGDVVPHAEGAPNRRSRNQVTVSTGRPSRGVRADHAVEGYVEELDRLDRLDRDGKGTPPALAEKVRELEAAGHLRGEEPGDVVETTRVWLRHDRARAG
ncbi:hypothetical protein [Mobilicoccus pelagius]|uniref:Fungal lipase-like domain-containing protein n=1 Tax=Mobilicoccus pelagius NBRC 104925 TaxID=1089455 RepID=H5UVW5_9MICO|nr:hypothetical protein [Mobilicoccus pelagius]GAB49873.1 hypothetical protein MOPEL_135_01110 [Mobilicoccus pelagius NBRC 104925]